MNETLAKMLSKLKGLENPFKRQPQKIGHEATPQKKIRKKYTITNERKKFVERKDKKRRKVEYQSRKINRLRS